MATKAMYCLNGTQAGYDDQNANEAVNPLFNVRHLPDSEYCSSG